MKKIIIPLVVIVILVAFSLIWYGFSEIASSKEQLQDEQQKLEQEKSVLDTAVKDLEEKQEKHNKDLEEFKEKKASLEKEVLQFEDEKQKYKAQVETSAVTNIENAAQENQIQQDYQNEVATSEQEIHHHTEQSSSNNEEEILLSRIQDIEFNVLQLENMKYDYPESSQEYRDILMEQMGLLEEKKTILKQFQSNIIN